MPQDSGRNFQIPIPCQPGTHQCVVPNMELRWGSYIKAPSICHGWVGKGTARARCAHLLDVQEHPRPVKLQANAMQRAKDIEMATNGIAMECHENDIPINSRNKLKTGISFGSSNWLAVDQDPIFNFDM
jgi:hypothetical protein